MTAWKKAKLWRLSKKITGCQHLGYGGRWLGGEERLLGQWKCTVRYHNDSYLPLLGCFSHDRTGVVCFGEEVHRGKVTSSSQISRVHTLGMIYQCWCWPWSPGWASAVRFLLHKVTLGCLLFLVHSWEKLLCTTTLRETRVTLHHLKGRAST